MAGVAGAQFSGGQLQVIIGTNVGKVYDEFLALTGLSSQAAIEENVDTPAKKKGIGGVVDSLFSFISGTMTPVLPALIISGLIRTLPAIFGPQLLGVISEDSNIFTCLTFMGDAGMYFLPMFLAVSACNKLKANWAIGVYLAGIMLHPTFMALVDSGVSFTVYGIPCNVQNYSSSFMPIMLTVWLMSYVERFFKKYIPDALQVMFVPFGTVMVMTPVALCVLGPIGSICSNSLCNGITTLYDMVGPLATMLVGGLFVMLVFTGMHPAFYVYLFASFPVLGYDAFFLPGTLAASWCMVGAFLVCMIKFKKKENKSFALTGFITWIAGGVGEPFMFGVLLRQRKLLVACMAGGAISGLVTGLTHLTAYVPTTSNGVYGLLAFVGCSGWNYVAIVITVLVAVVATFAIGMLLKIDDSDM